MGPAIVVVCGASHGPDGLHVGATAELWAADPGAVHRAVDELRVKAALAMFGPTHEALARLQQLLGPERCLVATTAVDGLLHKAGVEEITELRGSLFYLACAAHPDDHPRIQVSGLNRGATACEACGAPLRPDVSLPGERHRRWDVLVAAIRGAHELWMIDLDDVVAAALARAAALAPAIRTVGVGAGASHAEIALEGPADAVVPQLVEERLRGSAV